MTAFVLSAVLTATTLGPKEAEFAKGVDAARAKAIDFLKTQQTPKGDWEGVAPAWLDGMEGGGTALVTLALLEAGVPADDGAVAKAVEYLAKLGPKKTYVVSLQTQVLARVDAKKHAEKIQAGADWLLKNALRGDLQLDGWSYPQNNIADNSNTHFAVMGLHAAAQAGAKIDEKVWKGVRDFYARKQRQDGTWSYYNDPAVERSSVSMTTCGLLGLAVAAKYDKDAKAPGVEFEKGMPALLKLWGPSPKSEYYHLFATAELGRALGVNEFKAGNQSRAWYREGVEKLAKEQKQDGSFGGAKGLDSAPQLATAFGLYFLGPPKKS